MLRVLAVFFYILVYLYFAISAGSFESRNVCTNGGFEELAPNGFPMGWGPFAGKGGSFGVSKDSHSGNNALFLKSTSNAVVGVNRTNDALMPIIRGIARCWYKAVSSDVDGRNLQICVIAMNGSGDREVIRTVFIVPSEHVGDGQWHLMEIEFDFRTQSDAKLIHFAPRINETAFEKGAGEFLLDDVEITAIGLRIEKFGSAKPIIRIGETTSICLAIKNLSDQEIRNCEGVLSLPSGITTSTGEVQTFLIEKILPDEIITMNWQITGTNPTSGMIKIEIKPFASSVFFMTVTDLAEPELFLENEYISMGFFKTEYGYGIFSLGHSQYKAYSSMFSWLVYLADSGTIEYVPLFADKVEYGNGKYTFRKLFKDVDGVSWNFEFIFDLPPNQKWVNVIYHVTVERQRNILALYGPVLYTPCNNRYDAVFPGLEYLEDGENSSSTLDVAPPYHIRRVPHPNKVTVPLMAVSENTTDGAVITGMMWNAKKAWSKNFDRPSALFASPDRFDCMENYDVMGVFIPSVPTWVLENHTQAETPYILQPKDSIELDLQLLSIYKPEPDFSSIYAIPYWIEKYGLPQPFPLPKGSLEKELEFALDAYMDTLWVPEEQKWHHTLDWDPWGIDIIYEFIQQLWTSEKILPESLEVDQYLERANTAFKNSPYSGGDLSVYMDESARSLPTGAAIEVMKTQNDDGSWRFDPDWWNANDKLFYKDYHLLGKDGEAELGTCAQKTYTLLKCARMTGDKVSLEAGLKALDFMDRFKVPRAAQVWEVPVHTPDILASAQAIQAYLEAYKITDDRSYLDTAIYWAHTGLPFVYLWNNEDMPYMLYASIPVFGASWLEGGGWFGNAVQWNGLDYAYSLFDLAKYDNSLPWETIAKGLTISGLYQQETNEKYKGLYPDSYNFMDKTTSPWKLSPILIVRNLFVMMGYVNEPQTTIIRKGGEAVYINAIVPIEDPKLTEPSLEFWLKSPSEINRYIIIAGLRKPAKNAIMKAQQILGEVPDIGVVPEGWEYETWNGLLYIKLNPDSNRIRITISNPMIGYIPQIRRTVKNINWNFSQDGTQDWLPINDLGEFHIQNGALTTISIGDDPYMNYEPTKINASEYSELVIRMKTSKGKSAQVFWSTDSESLSESTSMRFSIISDGKFHDYIVPVGRNNKWKGIITSLRLDPTESADSQIAIESIIGRYVQLPPPSDNKINWHFKQDGIYDWMAWNDLDILRVQDGFLATTSTGNDPYMGTSITLKIDSSEYSEIMIRMKVSKGSIAQVFWATETEPISESTSVRFPIITDENFHDYNVTVSQNSKWKGTITSLRLDPTDSAGSEIFVVSIVGKSVKQNCVKGDVNGDGKIRSDDAILTLRISTGIINPSSQQSCAADMNNDNKVRADDAILILRKVTGLAAPNRKVVRMIKLKMGEVYGVLGQSITVPVIIEDADILGGGDISISYDSSILKAVSVSPDSGVLLTHNVNESGEVCLSFANIGGLSNKTLASIHFDLLADKISLLKFRIVKLYDFDALPVKSKTIDGRFIPYTIKPNLSMLLQNFPNPFNPETWIPYQLAGDVDVTIRIYDVSGHLIRTLDLGHKSAGFYTTKDKSAYWDGKNEAGEQVASGIYFYTIQAGDFTATKKIVITK